MIDPNLSWIHMFTYHFIGMLRSEFQTRYFQTLNGKHYCTRKWSSFEWHHGWIDLHECIERCNQLFCVFPTNSDIKRYKIFVRMQPVEPNINISVQHQKLVMMVFKMIQVFINMRYIFGFLGIENNIYGEGKIVNHKYSNKTTQLCQSQPLLCLFSGGKSIFITQHNEIICQQMLLTYLKVYSDISLR